MKTTKQLKLPMSAWFQMERSDDVKFPLTITMGKETARFSLNEARKMRTYLTDTIRAATKKKKLTP